VPVENASDGNTKGSTEVYGVEVDPPIGWCLTYPVNSSGHPAASIPAGLAVGNLPVGMQLIGHRYVDADVLAASAALRAPAPGRETYRLAAPR
jgi:amidase